MASSPSSVSNPSTYQFTDLEYRSYRVGADGSSAQATTLIGDWGYNAISTAATTVVKTGAGQLNSIQVLGGTLGAITVYDNTAASGTVIAAAFTPSALANGGPGSYVFNVAFGIGLTVVTGAATAATVIYR